MVTQEQVREALRSVNDPEIGRPIEDIGMLRSIDVDVVDVPGLEHPAFLGGARIERLWAFAPPTGAALSVTLVSHAGTCGIALNCDRCAVADPDLLTSCLEAALAEVVALGRQPHATARSGVPARRSA